MCAAGGVRGKGERRNAGASAEGARWTRRGATGVPDVDNSILCDLSAYERSMSAKAASRAG